MMLPSYYRHVLNVTDMRLLLGVGGRSSVNISIIMYCAGIIPLVGFECLFYVLWVNIGGYVWPMSFQGYIIMPAAGSSASVILKRSKGLGAGPSK